MGLAHLVGGTTRRFRNDFLDLDPAHRRDGLGMLYLALALVVAAVEWWGVPGPVGSGMHTVLAGALGLLAKAVPLVLVAVGGRISRTASAASRSGWRSWVWPRPVYCTWRTGSPRRQRVPR
jgi:S-DNA-T family DNA segregation ATPase FtsK/SpoIIIE